MDNAEIRSSGGDGGTHSVAGIPGGDSEESQRFGGQNSDDTEQIRGILDGIAAARQSQKDGWGTPRSVEAPVLIGDEKTVRTPGIGRGAKAKIDVVACEGLVSIGGGIFAFVLAGTNGAPLEPNAEEEARIGAALHDGIISLPSSNFILWLAKIAPWSKLIRETRRYLARVFGMIQANREARRRMATEQREPSFNDGRGRTPPDAPKPVEFPVERE